VVGHVGRLDPVKNHEMLIEAFARASQQDQRLRLVCIGEGDPARVAVLHALAKRLEVNDRVTFAGRRSDLAAVYSALDVLALTSVREGFPNVVAESMLCGIPAVVTDTGAAAEIVGSLGEVVPCGDVSLFAAGLQRVIRRRSSALSARCRLRILADFTLDRSAALTSAALQSLIPHFHARR
jgi:glycosyltransferase involved in cell wall biosynthesis